MFQNVFDISLRANSIYNLNINDEFTKIISNGRIFLEEIGLEILIMIRFGINSSDENVPSLITLEKT